MSSPTPTPNPWLPQAAYAVPRHPAPVDLRLDGNEGLAPSDALVGLLGELSPETLQRYPSPRRLEARLAERFDVDPECALVTAGGDEGLSRLCRAFLGPDRNLVLPEPSFEMIRRFAEETRAEVRSVAYDGSSYPTDQVLEACDAETSVIAVVSPNNPTGGVISAQDLRRLSEGAPQAILMVDLAYVEFAEEDLTPVALELPNAVVFRTFSKARGLAGLRVGYALGPARWLNVLRSVGLPYPVSAPALRLAEASLESPESVTQTVERLCAARERLGAALLKAQVTAYPSQGNFVFARGVDGRWWRDALSGLGIGVRAWPGSERLGDAVRISCPGRAEDTDRVCEAIETITRPEALLFDLDGVLADVSQSYRTAIVETAARFGVSVSREQIETLKARGDANNDWVVTWRLINELGGEASLDQVTEVFEDLYQGRGEADALYLRERLIGPRDVLASLKERLPLGIVTGRPRSDAERFLSDFELDGLFEVVITMEDAPLKPDPAPVRRALEALGARRAWMIGDTPDDVRSARAASVLPVGVIAPGSPKPSTTETLLGAGAAVVLDRWDQLQERLP